MKIKIGVMGSAGEPAAEPAGELLIAQATALGQSLAGREIILLTGATTGLVYKVGKAANAAGVFHAGISPASSEAEHVERYRLPVDACDLIIYTGFGLKGRNVVLVRSCDIAIFIAGSMGSLNEFTIAYDESKIIGCLAGTGGVADEGLYLQEKFSKGQRAGVITDRDPARLIDACVGQLRLVRDSG